MAWTIAIIALLLGVLVYAWIDGGYEEQRWIEKDLPVQPVNP